MRSVLIFLGVVFLVAGALFYFVPTPWVTGRTTVIGNGDVDVTTATASAYIPWPLTIAVMALGALLFLLGLALPDSVKKETYVERDKDVRTREYVDIEPVSSRTVVRERHVTHRH